MVEAITECSMKPDRVQRCYDLADSPTLPGFRTLDAAACAAALLGLARAFSLPEETTAIEFECALRDGGAWLDTPNPADAAFRLDAFLADAGFRPAPLVLVNWGRFDDVDEMNLRELGDALHDLWMPPADDIDIFDHSLQWIVNVSYIGKLCVWRTAR
jgi:hypothetical protein